MSLYRKPISVKDAIDKVIKATTLRKGTEMVPLEKANGRILAEPIVAKHDVPPFNRSAFDGYAIRAEDSIGATFSREVAFNVIGTIGAGHVAHKPLGKNEAYRIMTGALLPDSADAIIMLEETKETPEGFTINKSFQKNDNISFRGEDAKCGELLIDAGTAIHPGTVALLATFGYGMVSVSMLPSVSIIATGTELLEVEEELMPGKIRNSNGPMLQAQLNRMGIEANMLGIMTDNPDEATKLMEEALRVSDVVITTGGVSVGDFDYLPEVYERVGAEVLFNKVMMRPGSVTTVAKIKNKLLFGLSGNPSACFTGFELFTRPALLTMLNCTKPYLPQMKAILGEDFKKANPFTRFVRALWTLEEGKVVAVPAGFNKSNAVSSIARGNCIIVLPSGSSGYVKGMEVDVLLLGQEQGVATWNL